MKKTRNWVTPLTIGSFLLVGFTGVLMFFKVRTGLVTVLHEWLSLLLVATAVLHTWLNWPAVKAHLSRVSGKLIIGLFALLTVASVVPFGSPGGEHGDPSRQAAGVLLQARLDTLASLTGRSPEQVREALRQSGIETGSANLTLGEAARAGNVHPMKALAAVLKGVPVAAPGGH